MADLQENQVKLSDGRIITLKEATGSDEMIVASYLGEILTPDQGGEVIFHNCLIAMSVEKIDDVKVKPLRDFENFRDFMGGFKRKDWSKIRSLYMKLNSEGNDLEGK